MVEKIGKPTNKNASLVSSLLGSKQNEAGNSSQSSIKMFDGNYTDKERRQVVMKLIEFMKAT